MGTTKILWHGALFSQQNSLIVDHWQLQTPSQDSEHISPITSEPPADWTTLAIDLADNTACKHPVIMICGPKGSGKSSFARLLLNCMLSRTCSTIGIGFLDLDPGQPEFTPPGEISLSHIRSFNLGPTFTHPTFADGCGNHSVHSHYFGTLTPRDDILHFIECATDLFDRYQKTLRPLGCPLIVNLCGWVAGGGLELMQTLIQCLCATNVIYMSLISPEEILDSLADCSKASGAALHTVSSQPRDGKVETSTELRMMQTFSYFHLDRPVNGQSFWNPYPLYITKPLELRYTGPDQMIAGITMIGDAVNPNLVMTIINGSVLGLVVVEDGTMLAETAPLLATSYDQDKSGAAPSNQFMMGAAPTSQPNIDHPMSEVINISHALRNPSGPAIIRTQEDLPYIPPRKAGQNPVVPAKSQCIGQVLIRGIDTRRKTLQILTPIPERTLSSYHSQGRHLMLVKGKTDTPGWAYLEEYFYAMAVKHDRNKWRKYRETLHAPESMNDTSGEESDDFDVEAWAARTPWVEMSKIEEHRPRKDKVWRMRRNLQTTDGNQGS